MIYNRDESEVAVLGEVQKYKVGIDERNINHIVTILSSNLYSYPMISFLRETVSNAVDSHIEAKTDEPIIIYRTAKDLSIRDYGTGISPERFEEIYLNIGSSTKRQSNDYIGSFGIGRFSCLSVSDLANITSYYEGKAYYYVMNKDVDQLHIDLLDVLDTEEHNGVDVKIPLRFWNPENLACLAFINNIYVESEVDNDLYVVSSFNKRKIYSFKNFKAISMSAFKNSENTEILLGKIPYKVDYTELWDYDDKWHKSWEDCFRWVYPQIEIGQLDITPNREGLLYSERTKEVLRKTYDACIEELTELWNQSCSKEYDDIWEYMKRITSYVDNRLELPGTSIYIPVSDKLNYTATYSKHKEWDNLNTKQKCALIRALYNKDVDILARLSGETLYQGKRQERWFNIRRLFDQWFDSDSEEKKVVALPSKSGFTSQYFKNYVTEKYGEDVLFIRQLPSHITVSYLKHTIRQMWGITILSSSQDLHFVMQLLREVLLYLNQKVIVTDIISSPEYEKYKKEHAIKKNRVAMPTEKICFTINFGDSTNCGERITMMLSEIIPYCKRMRKNCQIVIADLDNPFIEAFKAMRYPNLIILSAAKNKMPLLYNNLPSWVKPIESLYSKDNRVLQKYAAARFILLQPEIVLDASPVYPEPIRDALRELSTKAEKYRYWRYSYVNTDNARTIINMIPPEKYDIELMALWNICKPWAELGFKLSNQLSLSSSSASNMFSYYFLMKNKKFRMNWNFYHEMKNCINRLLEAI